MNDIEVLIIGGYSLTEVAGGTAETHARIHLHSNGHLATVDFLKCLVDKDGNLGLAEKEYAGQNRSRLVARSLNTIYLYDFLTKHGIRAEALNYFLLEQEKFKRLMAARPKVVAISTTFISHRAEVNAIARAVRDLSPESVIIAGGVKVLKSFRTYNLFTQGYFDNSGIESVKCDDFFFEPQSDGCVDVFVIEECGELTLLDLVRKIRNDEDHTSTPNCAYRKNGELVFTRRIPEPFTFDTHAISWDRIPEDIVGGTIPVKAGMGCPFGCAFCDFSGLHRVRSRPIECVVNEIKLIQEVYPGWLIEFTDDNLFTTPARTKRIAEAVIKNNLDFKWAAFVRTDAISEDNVELMAESGCFHCALGIESGDNNVLNNMSKRITREQNLRAVHLLSRHSINTTSTVIVGFPGETQESVGNTIGLLNSYPDVDYPIHRFYPFAFLLAPLSPIASPDNRRKYALEGGIDSWAHSTMDCEGANEQLLRLFTEVRVPALKYQESLYTTMPYWKIRAALRERDNMVRGGLYTIDPENADSVYKVFRPIFEEKAVCHAS